MTTAALCAVQGCLEPVGRTGARGWCPRHYQRWLRHGDPLAPQPPGRPRQPAAELFWTKVNLNGPVPPAHPELGPCWVWTAATRGGYGAFNAPAPATAPRRRVDAHRWAFETYVAPVPAGFELGHLCHAADVDTCDGGPSCPHRACVNYQTHLVVIRRGTVLRGIAAQHAAQTTCPQGHRYDRVDAAGRRRCSRCLRAQVDRYHAERVAAVDAWLGEITGTSDTTAENPRTRSIPIHDLRKSLP